MTKRVERVRSASDRWRTLDDEKKRQLILEQFNFTLPAADIFDAPFRCYRINLEWTPIVMGFVSWLANVAAWSSASSDDYEGIQQISKMMEGEDCMDCQQLLDCLSGLIADANYSVYLQSFVSQSTWQQNNPTVTSGDSLSDYDFKAKAQAVTGGTETLLTCDDTDKDHLYSAIKRVIDYIHRTNLDILQRLTRAANVEQRAQLLISALPGVGLLPFDEVIGYAATLTDDVLSEYLATVDDDLLQSVYCDLFCLAVANDCNLNLYDIFDYFGSKLPSSFSDTLAILPQIAEFVALGIMQGTDMFFYMSATQLALNGIGFGNQSQDSAFAVYEQQIEAGLADSNHDWATFCTACPDIVWHYDFDFVFSDYGWVGKGTNTQYSAGVGWDSIAPQPSISLTICKETLNPRDVLKMKVYYSASGLGGNGVIELHYDENACIAAVPSQIIQIAQNLVDNPSEPVCWTNAGNPIITASNPDHNRTILRCGRSPDGAHTYTISRIELWSTDDDLYDVGRVGRTVLNENC